VRLGAVGTGSEPRPVIGSNINSVEHSASTTRQV